MKLPFTLAAIGSLAVLTACSTPGEGEAPPTQWKTVTRIINGNSVTYQVPMNQKVPNNVNTRSFVPEARTSREAPSPAAAAAPPAPPARTEEVAQAGPSAGMESPGTSQDADTALHQAESAVRDAQGRFESARKALERAREALFAGDKESAVKFANTAVSISRGGQ